jgi:hypothetical protein
MRQLDKLTQTCISTLIQLALLKDAGHTLTAPRVGAKHPHKTLRGCVLQRWRSMKMGQGTQLQQL